MPKWTFGDCVITVEAPSYADAHKLVHSILLGNDAVQLKLGNGRLDENPTRPWRPIEGAPRDRQIIGRSGDIDEVYSAEWTEVGKGWLNLVTNKIEPHITHWIPMPD